MYIFAPAIHQFFSIYMRRLLSLFVFAFVLSMTLPAQSMSDTQIMEYVKTSMQQGKDQRQIAMELARRGVTKEQALRVKEQYEKQLNSSGKTSNAASGSRSRQRTSSEAAMSNEVSKDFVFTPEEESDELSVQRGNDGLPVVGGAKENQVYGRNIFDTKNLTFEPSVNLATPPNYRLGPGDEIIIDIWGTNQSTIRQTISPDGYITIDDIGLIYLNGMTVTEASNYLRKELNKIYTGLDSDNPSSQIKVTLGNSRTIQVNVMGEVFQPGTYALSSFSTVFHALYRAGGVSNIGSLRSIQVVRNGKNIATVDVYDFIMKGKISDDIRLQEGDVIIIPPYEALVKIEGNVKRPMKYELKKNETVATLLKYAGGFTSDAYTRSLRLIRQNGKEYQVNTIDDTDYSGFHMKDGDVVTAEAILTRFENKLEIKGAVYRPGIYQYGGTLNTVRRLVEKAEGLMGDAFTGRAVLYRERENLTREVVQVDIQGIMEGTKPDLPLQRNDVLYIPSIHDLQELGSVTVSGEVANPGEYAYADNTTLEDIIIQAGGLKESASTVRVDVSRRIKDNKETEAPSTIATMYSFSLKDGFVIDGQPGFILQPYDQVYVRKSPGYQEQLNVSVDGEVLYNGTYTLTNKSERLSDLVQKAGGLTQFAYVRGAKLMRKASPEEMKRMQDVLKLMAREMGETNLDSLKLEMDDTYSVGIDLEEAMAHPKSNADVVLREGDRLIVPELINTVRINGGVMMANTVAFKENQPVKYYINQAGGYANGARKSKAFIVYMNGQVAKVKGSGKNMVEPGCEIVVPMKDKSRAGRWNIQTILGIASSLGSLGLTAASVANILK